MAKDETPDRAKDLLKQLISQVRIEDKAVRERQLRRWKRMQFMWEGFQHIWWSDTAHDWRVFDVQNANLGNSSSDGIYYERDANIFKAYLESIIAALSVTVPGILGVPDDATNPLDLQTARAAGKIAELIGKHNDEKLLWLHGLFTYVTQGQVFAYNYTDESYDYGSYTEPKLENVEEDYQQKVCPICKTNIPDKKMSDTERDEYDPEDDDILAHSYLNEGKDLCPQCLSFVDPELHNTKLVVTRLVGYISKPKARQCIECYGGTFVKVPNYAFDIKTVPYLILSREVHYSKLVKEFADDDSELAEKIRKSKSSGGFADSYDRWARLSPQYMGEYPLNTPTWNTIWFTSEFFYSLSDKDDVEYLCKRYPDGVKVDCVNDEFCCAENESMIDHWTLLNNPMANYVHFEPIGEGLVPMQEIVNEMNSLVLQTIEHGIPQTFANPNVLNFEQYRQQEATPGSIFPAVPRTGQNIQDGFYTIKTASLGQEVMDFVQYILQMAQTVSGALPSLWGGAQPNSSKTATQYSMSRAQSLQRLQNSWSMFCTWWKDIHGKVIPAFIDCARDDEKYVDQDEAGNFINVWIHKSELQGKIGSIELEAADQLPITWSQKKDVVMQLLASSNPAVMQAMTAPENIELVKEAIGIIDFVMPGDAQRTYQYEEIAALVASQPTQTMMPDPQTGQPTPQMAPSVDTNPFDDDTVHAGICAAWLVSETGQICKTENQAGYMNVFLHWQKHSQKIQQQQMQQMQMQETINQSKVSAPANQPKDDNTSQPVLAALRKNIVTQ